MVEKAFTPSPSSCLRVWVSCYGLQFGHLDGSAVLDWSSVSLLKLHLVHDQTSAIGRWVGVAHSEHGKPFIFWVIQNPGALHWGHKEASFWDKSWVAFMIFAILVGLVCALKSFSKNTFPSLDLPVAQRKASFKDSISLIPFMHSECNSSSGRMTNWCSGNLHSPKKASTSVQLLTVLLALWAGPPKWPTTSRSWISSIKITIS